MGEFFNSCARSVGVLSFFTFFFKRRKPFLERHLFLKTLLGIGAILIFSGLSNASPDEKTVFEKKFLNAQEILLEADRLTYDYNRDVVSAEGHVRLYYGAQIVEADRLSLDRRKDRLTAEGNVRALDEKGFFVQAEALTASTDLKDAFIAALQIDNTIQRTRFSAESAQKTDNITRFEKGSYTVYTDPRYTLKAPPWRIKAAQITYDESTETITYLHPRFEFFGHSVFGLPYLTHAYPAEGPQTGFLVPSFVFSEQMGYGVNIPFFWSLSPAQALTFVATPLSKQGVLGQARWEHALDNLHFGRGEYRVNLAGIHQSDPSLFEGSSGDTSGRFLLNTKGDFDLTSAWSWGWDATLLSDRAFVLDYSLPGSETSTLFLKGENQRNLFELRGMAFRIFQEDYFSTGPPNPTAPFSPVTIDRQEKQAFVHPVWDYFYAPESLFWGGEASFEANITSLTRQETDAFAVDDVNWFRGVAGSFTRSSVKGQWRRTLIAPGGHVVTPFAYAQGDLFFLADPDPDVTVLTNADVVFRGMPAVGFEYRYPLIGMMPLGTHVIEPTFQFVVRPNETGIGSLPNEDAQSLVLDDTVLFRLDKFSGFDRVEGGSRANLGLRYTLQMYDGSAFSALIGQSIQVAGRNSFVTPDIVNASADTGLDGGRSDYVASLSYESTNGIRFSANAQMDADDLSIEQNEIQLSTLLGPVTAAFTYAFLAAQPAQGVDDHRREIQTAGSLQISENWRSFGALRYDMVHHNFVGDSFGLAYDDEGLSAALAYSEDRSRNDGQSSNRKLYFKLGLRSLGDVSLSNSVDSYLN